MQENENQSSQKLLPYKVNNGRGIEIIILIAFHQLLCTMLPITSHSIQ